MMTSDDDEMIARSPSPPELDDDGEEWPVHGIVGEDVDVFGTSNYEIRWKNWHRPDGTNTTWMRDIESNPEFVAGWNEQIKYQRVRKAVKSQAIDLTLLASTPMHDRLTFECAEAVEEKMAERLREGPPGKLYRGWMTEIDNQVAEHEHQESGAAAKRVSKRPHHPRGGLHAEGSRWGLPRRRVARKKEGGTLASANCVNDDSGGDL